jgi:predicted kinase
MSYYVIIRGPLGCGKSTISEKLARSIKGEHFSIDRVLDDNNLTKDKEAGYISQKSFKKANEIAVVKAKEILSRGKPIVFDGNFYWKSQILDLIERLNFPHYAFTLKAPLRTCIERDNNRKKRHGEDAARAVYKKSTKFSFGKVVDVTKPADDCVNYIRSFLPKS